jgi:hypothetical protein
VYDLPEVLALDDALIAGMNDLPEEGVKAAAPGAYLVDVFPWMLYIPDSLAKWKKDLKRRYNMYCEMYGRLFRDVEKRIVSNL